MKRKLQKEWLRSYLWSGPSLLLIALVVVFPILYTFYGVAAGDRLCAGKPFEYTELTVSEAV